MLVTAKQAARITGTGLALCIASSALVGGAASSANADPVISEVSSYALDVPGSVLLDAAVGSSMSGVTEAELGAQLANSNKFNSEWITTSAGRIMGGSTVATPPPPAILTTAEEVTFQRIVATYRGAPAARMGSLVDASAAGAGRVVPIVGAVLVGVSLGAVVTRMRGIDVDGGLCASDSNPGINIASQIVATLSSTDCEGWRMSSTAMAYANSDFAITSSEFSCDSQQKCIKLVSHGGGYYYWQMTIAGQLPTSASAQWSYVWTPGLSRTSTNQRFYSGVRQMEDAKPDSAILCYSISNSSAPCNASGVGGALATTSTRDPERRIRCTVTMTDGTTAVADSPSFYASSGIISQPVLPAIPSGQVAASTSCQSIGGPVPIDILTNKPTTAAYKAWRTSFPECDNGSCATDLRLNGVSCLFQSIDCDGWISDPNRDTTYTCFVGTHLVSLSECFAYGPLFNAANRASGHAYGDPSTGLLTDAQTSPSEVDQLTGQLLTKGWVKWGPTEQKFELGAQDERSVARTVAAQCIALGITDDCETTPIFAPGFNVNEAAQHDLDAIKGVNVSTGPKPALLNYQPIPLRPSRSWYRTQIPCITNSYNSATEQCDEYPFASTVEGGPGVDGGPGASLRIIDKSHNEGEGTYLTRFYQVCEVNESDPEFLIVPIPWDKNDPLSPKFDTAVWCVGR